MFSKKNKKILTVEGMHCEHCSKKVTETLTNIDGIDKVHVNLSKKEVTVTMNKEIDDNILKEAIANIDFEVTEIK